MSPAWLSSRRPSFLPSSYPRVPVQPLQRGTLSSMSLLNPVLLPPRVKAYLSQGERFIKWDDVSGAGAVGCWGTWSGGNPVVRDLVGVGGLVYVCGDQAPVWFGQAADTAAWINKPGAKRVCPLSICPWTDWVRAPSPSPGVRKGGAAWVVTGESFFGFGSVLPQSP